MITLKDFIKKYSTLNRLIDWAEIPAGWPDPDPEGLTPEEIGKLLALKTCWEMAFPKKAGLIKNKGTRVWKDPEGYKNLAVWQNAALLRVLIRKFTLTLPLSTLNNPYHKPLEFRLKAQLDDAARSVKRNIEEGYKRPTTKEYLEFLGFSQGSLEEVKGDLYDAKTDGFLPSKPLSTLKGTLNIDLSVAKGTSKGPVKGEPTEPGHPYYLPLTTLKGQTLTYEIFMELINKTDFLLRKLVESLETM